MSEMKAPNSTAITRRSAVWFSRDFTHCGREDCHIAAPAFRSPSVGAVSEDLRKISSRQQ